MCVRSQPQLEVPMGKVVALSAYELNRGSERKYRGGNESAQVIMFTGVRYERIGKREKALRFKNERKHLNLGLPANSKS